MSIIIDFLEGEYPVREGGYVCQTENFSPLTQPKETLGKKERKGVNHQIKIEFRHFLSFLQTNPFSAEIFKGRIILCLSQWLQHLPVGPANNTQYFLVVKRMNP